MQGSIVKKAQMISNKQNQGGCGDLSSGVLYCKTGWGEGDTGQEDH